MQHTPSGMELAQTWNKNWEIFAVGSSLWNSYQLKSAISVIHLAQAECRRVSLALENDQDIVPMLFDNRDHHAQRMGVNLRQYLRAANQLLYRAELLSIIYGVRVIRLGAIFLKPVIRSRFENSVDIIAYAYTTYRYTSTVPPTQILYRRVSSYYNHSISRLSK